MKQLISVFSALCLAVPVLWAQTAQPAPALPPAAQPEAPAAAQTLTPVPSSLDGELFYQVLLGELTAREGDAPSGFALMLDAARKTNDAQLYQRAADIALQSRSGDAALQAAQAWRQAQPASREANRYVLQILLALNRITETTEPLKNEVKLTPQVERPQAITSLPRFFARVGDKKLAASVLEQALADELKAPATGAAAWTAVGRMRLAAGEQPGALEAAERGQALDPAAEGPTLLALELMDPKLPRAEALVQKYLAGNPKAVPEMRMAYARGLLDAQRYAEASAQLLLVTRDKPEYPEGWLVLGSLQLQDNQLAAAQTSLLRYLELADQGEAQPQTSRGLSQAYLSLAQIAEKRRDFAAAENWINKIPDAQELVQAQVRRASLLARQGKLAEARQLIRKLPERNADDKRIKLMAEVNLLREQKEYRSAYELLAQAVTQFPDEPELLYDQAMMAEKLNALPEMERLLRQVVERKPDYHHAYNALGYSLADRNVRLPEAKQLILKALEYAPEDPFIKDSLGWVEFRMGNKAEALSIFEAAYKAKPDAEIAAHFGEVLWSLGQRDRALAIWKEGMLLNAENETLLETLKRLRVRL
ncbi:MAG: tetratricopeptide repeat protein [Polaromonas sp.]|uniref:tetratricopeptide repeat protein n=1 Tax=Polaromonas sp. TaxID=1869339 RepID=UPI00271CAD0E|nr:tetratricopeptide repeat protein [Polaromonas sp.]MDO9115439.1 tetratricopeptide repeat protein [Polaromonas sp.]MDP1885186.1 tetratricopeptide repeat protein [Polaromonas sp.]